MRVESKYLSKQRSSAHFLSAAAEMALADVHLRPPRDDTWDYVSSLIPDPNVDDDILDSASSSPSSSSSCDVVAMSISPPPPPYPLPTRSVPCTVIQEEQVAVEEEEMLASSSDPLPSSSFYSVPSTPSLPSLAPEVPSLLRYADIFLPKKLADPLHSISSPGRPLDKRNIVELSTGTMNRVTAIPVPLVGLERFSTPFVFIPFPRPAAPTKSTSLSDALLHQEALRRIKLQRERGGDLLPARRILSPFQQTHELSLEDGSRYGFCAHTSLYSIAGHTTLYSSVRKFYFAEILLPAPQDEGSVGNAFAAAVFRHPPSREKFVLDAARNLTTELSFDEAEIRRGISAELCSFASTFCKECFFCNSEAKLYRCCLCERLVSQPSYLPGGCPVTRVEITGKTLHPRTGLPPGIFFLCKKWGCQDKVAGEGAIVGTRKRKPAALLQKK
jgi:hypothetical protein